FIMSFFFQAEDGIRDFHVTGVQTCALPIYSRRNAVLEISPLCSSTQSQKFIVDIDRACASQSQQHLSHCDCPASSRQAPKVFRAARDKSLSSRSEEHTSELQSRENLLCRPLLG